MSIAFKVGLSFKVLPKSPMGYFVMNLNMVITLGLGFHIKKFSHTYLLSPTKSLALNFLIIKKNYNKTKKKVCLLPFANIFKLVSFTFFIYIYIYIAYKISPKMHPTFIFITIDL